MDPYGMNKKPETWTGRHPKAHYSNGQNRNKPCAHGVPEGKECSRCNDESFADT